MLFLARVSEYSARLIKEHKLAFCIFIILLISFAEFRTLYLIHLINIDELANQIYGVLTGKPHWRSYSSRLLGPHLVYVISLFGFSLKSSLIIFHILAIITVNALLFYVLLLLTGRAYRRCLISLVLFGFSLILIQHQWHYTWDYIDLIVFTLFLYGVYSSKTTAYFCLVFLLGILNRESALFIALWLVIDAFKYASLESGGLRFKLSLHNKWRLLVGASLLIGGAIYTKMIRSYMFVESSSPAVGLDEKHRLLGNHTKPLFNIEKFFSNFLSPLELPVSLFIIAIFVFVVSMLHKAREETIKSAVLVVIMIASIFTFGTINETRQFTMVLPFLLFFYVTEWTSQKA